MTEQWSFDLKGRVAAIVGAGSGIGEAVARGAGALGAKVACLDVDAGRAEATAAAIREAGGDATSGSVDIRDAASVGECFDGLKRDRGSNGQDLGRHFAAAGAARARRSRRG
jgi:NAD(P)-dependent dehydrogenase (short-subunit alcohol dehydrogenase family)